MNGNNGSGGDGQDEGGDDETALIPTLDDLEPTRVITVTPTAAGAIAKSEIESQLDAAHKYPRSVRRFLQEASALATMSQEVAESCIYALPRGGKVISGPSVRLAEICASAYGNLHIGARVVDVGPDAVTSQGVAWDLEKNLRVSTEVRRRITRKNGARFDDDMIIVTGNAGASIALRNAVFRVIPKSYVQAVYEKAKLVAIGKGMPMAQRRDEVVGRLVKMGATEEAIYRVLEIPGREDINAEKLEILIGLGTAIKNGDKTVDECFPPPLAPAPGEQQQGRRVSLGKGKDKGGGEDAKEGAQAANQGTLPVDDNRKEPSK